MKTRCRGVAIAAVASTCMLAWGCRADTPVTFGIVLDPDGVRGATVAMEEINARGGVNGRPVALRSVGGASSTRARLALETAETLAADPAVLAVVGHTNSAASLAASQVYNARRLVQIAPTSSTPVFSNAGPYSFRLVGSDVHQGPFLAQQVLVRKPRPRTAVLFVNDDYGRPLRRLLVEHLRRGGITPVHDSPYVEGAPSANRAEMVAALARARPDLLVWIGRAYEYVPILDMVARALPHLEVIASDGFSGIPVTNDSLHRLDGVHYVRFVDWSRTDSGLSRLRARYRRAQWGEPSDQAVLSHDAVLVLGEAVRHAGAKREAIREWLARVGSDVPAVAGLSGPIAFLPNGDRAPRYWLEKIGRARLDSVQRPSRTGKEPD